MKRYVQKTIVDAELYEMGKNLEDGIRGILVQRASKKTLDVAKEWYGDTLVENAVAIELPYVINKDKEIEFIRPNVYIVRDGTGFKYMAEREEFERNFVQETVTSKIVEEAIESANRDFSRINIDTPQAMDVIRDAVDIIADSPSKDIPIICLETKGEQFESIKDAKEAFDVVGINLIIDDNGQTVLSLLIEKCREAKPKEEETFVEKSYSKMFAENAVPKEVFDAILNGGIVAPKEELIGIKIDF